MGVRVKYTSGYDRFLFLLKFFTFLAWLLVTFFSMAGVGQLFESWLDSLSSWIKTLIEIVFFLCVFGVATFLHSITTSRWISIYSAYLYIRISLKTKISFRDANYLAWLFVPNETGRWYPMREIRQMPRELRRQYLLNKAAEIYRAVEIKKSILAK